MNMVERVARAIDPEAWQDNIPVPTRDSVISFHARRQRSCDMARAAIEAMREPTAAMVLAVSTEEKRRGYFSHEAMDADDAWPIMITAALEEQDK